MPKNFEVESNAMDRSLIEEEEDDGSVEGPSKKQLSKKELGRFKSKKALLEMDTGKVSEEERRVKKTTPD
jgi:hypothetical protein